MKILAYSPRHALLTSLALLLVTTSGCQVWVKRGAGQAELQADQSACKAETGASSETAAFNSCMKGKGWYNESADQPASTPASPSADAAPAAAVAGAAASPAGTSTSTSTPTMDSTESAGSTASTAAPPAAAAPVAPPAPVTVNSWWKLGGSPGELFSTREQCGQETGDPASGNSYSQAFIDCMKSHQWFAMR